ncbi:MAG: F-type H+-transporting ATPase subunit gamma [Bacillota bacterium]|nr:MAG: F-type H+-transporting ATPase subunit gamma [Bacillota bacterium]MBS3950140.1 F0F1 ATP synthase subunit gamma [Peptococcaceae bacterium]
MATMRDIRRRIKSVKNTQQITKAMKMVSASKLRKAQGALLSARPYAERMRDVLMRVAAKTDASLHPLLVAREGNRRAYLIVTADRGLCGGFNANLIRKAVLTIREHGTEDPMIIAVGRKGRDYFKRRLFNLVGDFTGLGENISFSHAKTVADAVRELYTHNLVDEVWLVYPHFVNPVTQRHEAVRLLPLQTPESTGKLEAEYVFEPTPEEVLDHLLPRYLNTVVFRALLEAKAGEHGARMAAMDAASSNAEDMIKRLTLIYNRARQASITREISELVAGAEALK